MLTGKVNEQFDSNACTWSWPNFPQLQLPYAIALSYTMDDLYIPFLLLLRTASVTMKMKQRAMDITTAIASTAYMARIAIASGLLCVPAC